MQSLKATLPAQTAGGAASTTYAGVVSSVQGTNNNVRKVWITAPSGMSTATAHASNNVTVSVGKITAGVRTEIATLTTNIAGGSIVAGTPKAIPVTAALPSGLAPGDLIDVVLTQNGSGVALAAGAIVDVEVL